MSKVENVSVNAYDWPQENLAREESSQGERLTVFRSFLRDGLLGKIPEVHHPIQASTPNDEGEVAFVVSGQGRLTSVQAWNDLSADDRLREALNQYRMSGKGKEVISAEQWSEITLDTVTEIEELSESVTGVDPATLQAAFETEILVPVIWTDKDKQAGKVAAYSDLVDRDEAKIADHIKMYPTLLAEHAGSKTSVAAAMHVTPSRVTAIAAYVRACNLFMLSEAMQRLIRLHNGHVRFDDAMKFDKVRKLLRIFLKGAKHLQTVDGEQVSGIHFTTDEQSEILSEAIVKGYDRDNKGRKDSEKVLPPDVEPDAMPDEALTRVRFSDFLTASQGVETRRITVSVNGESVAVPTTDPDKAHGSRTRPTPMSTLDLFQKERWEGTRVASFIQHVRRFLVASMTAAQFAEAMKTVKCDKPKREITMEGLPTELGVAVTSIKPPKKDK